MDLSKFSSYFEIGSEAINISSLSPAKFRLPNLANPKWLGVTRLPISFSVTSVMVKPSRALCVSWAQRPFCVSHFLITGNGLHLVSMTFHEFQRSKHVLVREGSKSGDQSRNSNAAFGQGHTWQCLWAGWQMLRPGPDGRSWLSVPQEHVGSRLVRTSRLRLQTPPPSPPANQEAVHELTTPSLNPYCKTPHYPLQNRTCSFEGISPLWPPLPGKAIKLLFSTSPKTLSEIQFSIRVQRPDLTSNKCLASLKSLPHGRIFL